MGEALLGLGRKMPLERLLLRDNSRPIVALTTELLVDYSIEVLPRHAAEYLDPIKSMLPERTRIYIPQTEGTAHSDVGRAARLLAGSGFTVMPHIPARMIMDAGVLERVLKMYREDAGGTAD